MPDKITHEEALEALKNAYADLFNKKTGHQVLSDDQIKQEMKDGFKELLNEKVQEWGYFSMKSIAIFVLGGLITFVLVKFGIKTG